MHAPKENWLSKLIRCVFDAHLSHMYLRRIVDILRACYGYNIIHLRIATYLVIPAHLRFFLDRCNHAQITLTRYNNKHSCVDFPITASANEFTQ